MNRLADIQRRIAMTGEAVSRAERALAQHPELPSTAATLRGFVLMRERLEQEFLREAESLELGVFSYRVEFAERVRPTILGLTSALGTFQRLFTTVYDAVLNGPKKKASWSTEVAEATAFGFSYTFPGSVGFMMTLPIERLLVGKTNLDEAVTQTFRLIRSRDEFELQAITNIVGLPAVRTAHQWAMENDKAGFGADMIWQPNQLERSELRIQPEEIREFAYVASSAMAKEQLDIIGELTQLNMSDRSFQMKTAQSTITGTFSNAISAQNPAQLPKTYLATLTVSTKVALVDGIEQISYFLVRLDEPPTLTSQI